MVKSHCRVYPTVYIRQSVLNSLQPSLRQLEQRTGTTVFYNEAGEYFDITGQDQQACDKARDKIATALLPRLNRSIDERSLKGTYKTLSIIRDEDLIGVPVTGERKVEVVKINRQPLKLDDNEHEENTMEEEDDSDDDDKLIIDTFNISPRNGDYLKLVGKATRTDCALLNRSITISGYDEESVNDALERFKTIQTTYLGLSKRMLVPCIDYPPQYGESGLFFCNIQYDKKRNTLQSQFFPDGDFSGLHIILPVLEDPNTGQWGAPKDLILRNDNEQLQRQYMQQQQMLHQRQEYEAQKQRNKEAMMSRMKQTATLDSNYMQITPEMARRQAQQCNRMPPPPSPSNNMAYMRLSPPTQAPYPSTNSDHVRPSPLMQATPSNSVAQMRQPITTTQAPPLPNKVVHVRKSPSPQRIPTPSSPPQPTYISSPPLNYDHSRASSAQSASRQYSSDINSVRTLDEFEPPLWGTGRSFTNAFQSGISPLSIDDHVKPPTINDFPMLTKMDDIPRRRPISRPSSRASSVKSVESGRRVMRIVNQKSTNAGPVTKTPWQVKDDYNFENIKMGLEEGLGAVRGFKGEIKLSAKLGKVLWDNVNDKACKRIWEYTDIMDVLVREYGFQPYFSDITTVDNDIVDSITDKLPNRHSVSYFYEFHCLARSMPQCEYRPTVLYMNESSMDLTKVSVTEKKLTQVDWISLDRKMDFELALTTKELVRPNAKPYTTFIKWVSVCPTTRLMTFEEVNDFLYVDYVLHKETSRYKAIFPFMLEITRVEKVVLREVKSTQYTKAKKLQCQINTGNEVWYDIELVHPTHALRFRSNIDLDTGKIASWDVKDILGEDGYSDLHNYLNAIKSLVNLTEQALYASHIN